MTGVSNFQIVGLALSAGIIAIILRQQRVGIFNEDLVLVCSLLCLITQLLDAGFRLFITRAFIISIPASLINITYKFSLVFAISAVVIMAMLLLCDFLPENKHNLEALLATLICLFLGSIIIFTKINCIFDNGQILIYGISNFIAHILICIIVFVVLVFAIVNRKKISQLKKLTIGFWCFSILQGSILDYYVNEVQCLGFNIALSLFIIICLAENIENHYNNELESFNYESFYSYITIKYAKKSKLSLLYFYAFNEYDDYRKEYEINKVIDDALKKIRKKEKLNVFKTQTNELIICSKNEETISECSKALKAYVEEHQQNIDYTYRFYSLIVNVSDINIANTYTELLKTFNECKEHVSKDPLNITYIDLNDKYVEEKKKEDELLKIIDESLDNNDINLALQPVINSNSKNIELFEAKTYIKKENTIIHYEEIISKIEKNERFIIYCKSMIEKACDVYKELKNNNQNIKGFIINFLSYQLEDQQLINAIIDVIANKSINPNCVYIKAIELKDVHDKKLFISNVHKLSEFGVKIICLNTSDTNFQLEDVSAPYIDGVIINHRFLQRAMNDSKVNIMFSNISQLAHKLNKIIFANGIANKETVDTFIGEGIDYIQGKYLYKWMELEEFMNTILNKGENA